MDASSVRALYIALSLVVVGGGLLALLRHLRVPARYFVWTLGAHVVFVAILGFAVAPNAKAPAAVEDGTIEVALLPPIPQRPDDIVPTPAEAWVRPEPMQVVTPRELPRDQTGASVASQMLSDPSARNADANLRRIAPDLSGGTVARSTRLMRPDAGQAPTALDAPTAGSLADLPVGARVGPQRDSTQRARPTRTPRRAGGPGAPSASSAAKASVALPSGYELAGEAAGRRITHMPKAIVSEGKDGGKVTVSFSVTPSGRVQSTVVKRKAGSPLLERLAREWAAKLKFAPLAASVAQTSQRGEITVDFRKE